MKYFKNIEDHFIASVSTGAGMEEITQEEYRHILSVVRSAPEAEEGFSYRLKTDLTWELVELPPVEDEPEATETDYLEALAELGVKVNEEI